MSGKPSSNMPASMWTRCETYIDACRDGIIVVVSGTYGWQTKRLMTVVSPLTETSHDQLSELLNELHELWPLVPPD
jgi:hypothetical protein